MGYETCLNSLYLDAMSEICLYLEPKDIGMLFGCGDILLSQRLSENGCIRSIHLQSLWTSNGRCMHRLIRCLPHLKALKLTSISETVSLLSTISTSRSSPLHKLTMVGCQFEDSRMPTLGHLFPELKTFVFKETFADSAPSYGTASMDLFCSLPNSLEVLDCVQTNPGFFIESQRLPNLKKMIVSSRIAEGTVFRTSQMSKTLVSDLLDAVFANYPLLEVLGLPELKVSEKISKKVFPGSITRLMVTEAKNATRPFFDMFEAPNILSLRYTLQKVNCEIIFPPTLVSLCIQAKIATVVSLDSFTSFPPSLTKLKLRHSGSYSGDRSRFFSILPSSLKYFEVSVNLVDYALLPQQLETLIVIESEKVVQPRPGPRHMRRLPRRLLGGAPVEISKGAKFPASLTELDIVRSILPISHIDRLPPLLRKLKVRINESWKASHVIEMANRLPVCSISILGSLSVEVGSLIPISATKFDLRRDLYMALPHSIRSRVQVKKWHANFSSKLPTSLTHVNVDQTVKFDHNPFGTKKYELDASELLPALKKLNQLVFLKISVNDGAALQMDLLNGCCPSLLHLELITSSCLTPFSPKNLPRSLTTFRSNFLWPGIVDDLAEFPTSITDLKLVGESVAFDPISLEDWPISLKRLEFQSINWSDVEMSKLRDRLIHVQEAIVWGSVILTGQMLSSAIQISQIYDLTMETLPLVMNTVLAPFRVLEYDFQPKLVSLKRVCPIQYSLPDEILSLELSDPQINLQRDNPLQAFLMGFKGELNPSQTDSAEVTPRLKFSSLHDLPTVFPTSLTSIRLSLAIENLFDTLNLPPRLTDLKLVVLPDSFTTKPFAKFPDTLTCVSILHHKRRAGEEIIVLCEPGHLTSLPSPLRRLEIPPITFSPCDIPDVPKGLVSLDFFGGPIWDEVNIQELLGTLPNLVSLHLSRCSAIGSGIPADVTEVGPQDLQKYADKSLKQRFPNVHIDIGSWLQIKPLRMSTGLKTLNLVDPQLPMEVLHSEPRDSLADFGIISPFLAIASNLVELSFQVSGAIHSMTLGSALPRQLIRLTVVADSFIPTLLHWSVFPRTLKSIRMYQPLNSLVDEAVGFPPHLEELIVPQHNFTSAILKSLPSSLTLLDVATIADTGASDFMLKNLPWAPGSRYGLSFKTAKKQGPDGDIDIAM